MKTQRLLPVLELALCCLFLFPGLLRSQMPQKPGRLTVTSEPPGATEVVVWDKRVGALAADPRLGCYVFAYDPAWKRTAVELAPLTMPLDDRRRVFRSEEHTSEL